MPSGATTFPAGHFKAHNDAVVKKLHDTTDLKAAVKAYGLQIASDALALHKAGASDAQITSSMQALDDQFDTAWAAMVANTKFDSLKG